MTRRHRNAVGSGRRRIGIAALAAVGTLLGGLALTGCSQDSDRTHSTPPADLGADEDLVQIDPDGGTGPSLDADVTTRGAFALHDLDGVQLLAAAEEQNAGNQALATGALAVNEHGCFGLSGDPALFRPIIFPYGTSVAGPDTISFDGTSFALGEKLALGGGMREIPTPSTTARPEAVAEYEVATQCGFTTEEYAEGAFAAWGEVQSLADFESEYPSAQE